MKSMSRLIPLLGLALLGCPSHKGSPDDDGCEHLKEGPAAAVTATSGATGAPSVSDDHKRYDITLPGGAAGYVQFAVSEGGGYLFFLDQDVPFKVSTGAGADVSIESSSLTGAKCPEVKGRHLVHLEVGTYRLALGPASGVSKVGLVIEGAAHH